MYWPLLGVVLDCVEIAYGTISIGNGGGGQPSPRIMRNVAKSQNHACNNTIQYAPPRGKNLLMPLL